MSESMTEVEATPKTDEENLKQYAHRFIVLRFKNLRLAKIAQAKAREHRATVYSVKKASVTRANINAAEERVDDSFTRGDGNAVLMALKEKKASEATLESIRNAANEEAKPFTEKAKPFSEAVKKIDAEISVSISDVERLVGVTDGFKDVEARLREELKTLES